MNITDSSKVISCPGSADSRGQPKWAVLVNDRLVPMPRRVVPAAVIRAQAPIPVDMAIIRDHNSPDDVVVANNASLDLAEGNVFYTLPACDVAPRGKCAAPAKLALFVGDRWEVVLLAEQTGLSIKQLFGLDPTLELLRDHESPNDEPIADTTAAHFGDGPVFVTRRDKGLLAIIVNKKTFTTVNGVKPKMTGREIAALVTPQPDATEVNKITGGTTVRMPLDQAIPIHNCDEFEVIRNNVAGGLNGAFPRVKVELARLQSGGARVTLVEAPVFAVVYHELRTRADHPVRMTDVLVLVPGGYPGASLDGAFLPQGSPLLGRVPGSPQGTVISALGDSWQLVSYHPHNGGGSPPWNKDLHGFHTYYDDVIAWLRK